MFKTTEAKCRGRIKVLSVCNGGELVHFVKMTIAAMVMFIGLVPQLVKSIFKMWSGSYPVSTFIFYWIWYGTGAWADMYY